jgi:hypothetical protein
MPAAFLPVEKNPPETEAEKKPGKEGGKEAQGRLTPVKRFSVRRQDFDFPGAHAQGLAAARPEPGEKQEADADQVGRVEKLVWPEGIAGIERQYGGGGGEQHRCEQNRIVNNGRQTAKESGRGMDARQTGVFSRGAQLIFEWRDLLAEIHGAASEGAQHDQ